MFEDSIFESTGKIRTRSRSWMIATFLLNGSVVLTLILIPLIYPEALPRQALPWLLTTPAPPPTPPPPAKQPRQLFQGLSEMPNGGIVAPPDIPRKIVIESGPEVPPTGSSISMDQGATPGGGPDVFRNHKAPTVVHAAQGPVRLPSTLVAGLLLYKATPHYPPIAVLAHIEGTVVLLATISKSGTIEDLRAVSGPAMLQQSAIDAVKIWRYRPYLLNGEPVEVETTVNVVFAMNR